MKCDIKNWRVSPLEFYLRFFDQVLEGFFGKSLEFSKEFQFRRFMSCLVLDLVIDCQILFLQHITKRLTWQSKYDLQSPSPTSMHYTLSGQTNHFVPCFRLLFHENLFGKFNMSSSQFTADSMYSFQKDHVQ